MDTKALKIAKDALSKIADTEDARDGVGLYYAVPALSARQAQEVAFDALAALSAQGEAAQPAAEGYELAETVHGEIVRIKTRQRSIKEPASPAASQDGGTDQ